MAYTFSKYSFSSFSQQYYHNVFLWLQVELIYKNNLKPKYSINFSIIPIFLENYNVIERRTNFDTSFAYQKQFEIWIIIRIHIIISLFQENVMGLMKLVSYNLTRYTQKYVDILLCSSRFILNFLAKQKYSYLIGL